MDRDRSSAFVGNAENAVTARERGGTTGTKRGVSSAKRSDPARGWGRIGKFRSTKGSSGFFQIIRKIITKGIEKNRVLMYNLYSGKLRPGHPK